jgi:hypothetical protein
MRYEIKNATTQMIQSNHLITFGTLQRQGGDGTPEVPGGGGREYAFFKLDHRQVERERWNRQQKNFEKIQRQTTRLINKINGFGSAGNQIQEPKYRTQTKRI